MGYDDWLERPYQDAWEHATMIEKAWEQRGIDPEDIEPPHKPGDACPVCGEPGMVRMDEDEVLCCGACGADIDRDMRPTFSIEDYAEELAERFRD